MNQTVINFQMGILLAILSSFILSISPYTEQKKQPSPIDFSLELPEERALSFNTATIGLSGAFPGLSDVDLEKGQVELSTSSTSNGALEDGLKFSFTELCGDGEVITKVDKIEGNGFAGISFRESLDPGAKMISLFKRAHNYYIYKDIRLDENKQARKKRTDIRPIDEWLKIERRGSMLHCSTSSNGVKWTPIFNVFFPAEQCLLAGLAVQSESLETTTSASFNNLMILQGISLLTKPEHQKNTFASVVME